MDSSQPGHADMPLVNVQNCSLDNLKTTYPDPLSPNLEANVPEQCPELPPPSSQPNVIQKKEAIAHNTTAIEALDSSTHQDIITQGHANSDPSLPQSPTSTARLPKRRSIIDSRRVSELRISEIGKLYPGFMPSISSNHEQSIKSSNSLTSDSHLSSAHSFLSETSVSDYSLPRGTESAFDQVASAFSQPDLDSSTEIFKSSITTDEQHRHHHHHNSHIHRRRVKSEMRRSSILVDGSRRISHAIKRMFTNAPLPSVVPVDQKGFTREFNGRKILMYSIQDVELFDKLMKWKLENPTAPKSAALKLFSNHSDAIIDILFEEAHVDYILKFDNYNAHQNIRDTFEKEVLKLGFFLDVEKSFEVDNHYYIKVIAPFRVLCRAAEIYNLRRPLREPPVLIPTSMIDKINKSFQNRFLSLVDERIDLNLQTAVFKEDELRSFRGTEEDLQDHVIMSTFFKPFYRALLTRYMIESIQVKLRDQGKFEDQTFGIQYLVSQEIYLQYFYPHDILSPPNTEKSTLRDRVYQSWVKTFWQGHNLKDFRDYFGEKLALHFAFCRFYRNWLVVFALAGLVVTLLGIVDYSRYHGTEERSWRRIYDNRLSPWFALAISFWSAFFLEFWKRRNNYLSYVWLTYTFEDEDRIRPDFQPTEMSISIITGKTEPNFPLKRRLIRQFQSACVLAFFLFLVVSSVLAQIVFTIYLKTHSQFGSESISMLSGLVGLLMVKLLKIVYSPVAEVLNIRENYKTETQHEDNLIIKNWLFDYVNVFSRLLYYAFLRPALTETGLFNNPGFRNDCVGNCTTDLFIQVIFLFMGEVIVGKSLEYLALLLDKYWSDYSDKKNRVSPLGFDEENLAKQTELGLPQYYKDDKLPVAYGANSDYKQKVAQFGLLTAFSTVFPMAPVLALLNNTLDIHMDAYKYLVLNQRVTPMQAQNIGNWFNILQFQAIFAVSVNAGINVFYSQGFEDTFLRPYFSENDYSSARFSFFVMWHVIVHGLSLLISFAVPDDPYMVKIAKKRQRYLERSTQLSSKASSPETQTLLPKLK